MYFLALAADYDGTLADQGVVSAETLEALRAFKRSGRRLLLVTGRELDDLRRSFPDLPLFDRVIAENGGLLYDSESGRERLLGSPPPAEFVRKLMEKNVAPISVGRTIVATWRPHETAILQAIQELHLDLQITFNKAAVMVLPPGVNKTSGLKAALDELDLSPHNVVAVGDAENDYGFMAACGCSAAVANALPTVAESADIRLKSDHGAGVVELLREVQARDMGVAPLSRLGVDIGPDRDGAPAYLLPTDTALVVGPSGCGKSSFATRFTELLVDKRFEFCVIDPEGDYENLRDAIRLGDGATPPSTERAIHFLRESGLNLVVNTIAMTLDERQRLLETFLRALLELRHETGRPHFLLIDEAHHFLPRSDAEHGEALLSRIPGVVLITVKPELVARAALAEIDVVLGAGPVQSAFAAIAEVNGVAAPRGPVPNAGEFLFWRVKDSGPARIVPNRAPAQPHNRHRGKYAAGDVGRLKGFRFGHLGEDAPCAKNLNDFVRLAAAVEDGVWLRHLRSGDFAAWFLNVIRDEQLARTAAEIGSQTGLPTAESRRRIIESVKERYVLS
ncbi:HAD-IIB family hydrolase [Hansschlegelia zhihuaiae]|uniref:HAD-IIB family hydrolase n=1 Tax=Hansschlegelia zhihuaiae TaxID=405005 RepID=A0A4V1KI93_9HYPH|nr:HAD-IIB family hydrolase [Hansschlegelia zhihuaiae]RXF69892.1 HAD-IIB family hydrolase [Hansschlegelia zhihuaiae]